MGHKHKYHFFSEITNGDSRVEAKVKYFFDCLSLAFNFTNKHYDFPCENYKTVVTSIYYQIRYNEPRYAKKHIEMYLGFLFGDSNQFAFFDYDTQCLADLKNYIDTLQDQKADFKIYEQPIKTLLTELNTTYFTKCLEKIVNHVTSDDELDSKPNDHCLIECIFEHTKVLAVEFYMTGASSDDINNILRNICNRSTKKYEQTRHLRGTISNLDEYYEKRNLQEQLHEVKLMYELFGSSQIAIFFIEPHYKFNNKVDFKLFGVHFRSDVPREIDSQKFNKYLDGLERTNAVIDENTLFASVNVESNHSNTIQSARKKVLSALGVFSEYSENQYILSFAYYLSKNNSRIPHKDNIPFKNEEINEIVYDTYRKNKLIATPLIDDFLRKNDEIFITGIHNPQRSQILIHLWFYFESYFDNSKRAISKTSALLANRMKEEFEKSLYLFLHRKYFDFNGLHEDVQDQDRREFYINSNSEIPDKLEYFKRRFKHPVITNKLIKMNNGKFTEKVKYEKFLSEFLEQVYIYRNLYVHSLNENQFFTGNNLSLLIRVSNFFRQDLISRAIENSNSKE